MRETMRMYSRRVAAVFIGLIVGGAGQGIGAVFAAEQASLKLVGSTHVTLDGNAPEIVLKNEGSRHRLDSVNIQRLGSTLQFSLKGGAACQPNIVETRLLRTGRYLESVHFDVGPREDRYWSEVVFENVDTKIYTFKGKRALSIPEDVFQKTMHQFDAVNLFIQKVRSLRTSDKRLQYLKKDQKFRLKVPLRIEAICREFSHGKITNKTHFGDRMSVLSELSLPVNVIYRADPKLTKSLAPKLKIKKGVDVPALLKTVFFKATDAAVLLGPKNLRGACPLTAKFAVEIVGKGQGWIKLRALDGKNIVYESKTLKFENGITRHDFLLSIGGKDDGEPYKKYAHQLKFQVFSKQKRAHKFSAFSKKLLNTFYWQHSCINIPK